MNTADIIKKRREELGLSQEELAAKLGYKSRSSINKIELGLSDIPFSKIPLFAKALELEPEILMGWGEEKTFRNQVVHGANISPENKIKFIKSISEKLNEGYSIDEIARILSFPNIDKFLNDTIFEKDLLEMAKNDTGVFNSLADTVVLLTKQAFKKAGLTFDSEDEEINRETFEDVVNRKNMSEILEREISKYNKREIYDFYINENLAGDIKYKNKKISIIMGDPKDKSTFKELDLNSDKNIKLGTVISLIQLALEKVELDNQGYKGLENLISSIVIKNYNEKNIEKETQKKKLIRTKRSHSIDNLNKNVTELAALKGMHKK